MKKALQVVLVATLTVFIVSGVGFGQSELPSVNYLTVSGSTAGVTLNTAQTITGQKTFNAALLSGVISGQNAVAYTNGQRISLGGAYMYADAIGGGRVITAGGNTVTGTLETQAHLVVGGRINNSAVGSTIADNGNGGTAAASTLTPGGSFVPITCNDAQGCDVTLGEGSATSGDLLRVINVSSNTVNMADTPNVSETNGAFAMGINDSITYLYVVDRWVEQSRSNN